MIKGKIFGVGVGPGDPELLTLKAVNILNKTKYVVFFKKKNKNSIAQKIAEQFLSKNLNCIPFTFPLTTEFSFSSKRYKNSLSKFYDQCCKKILKLIDKGEDVLVLCEGDPFFYGSFMHLYRRLCLENTIEVIPGITGMSAAWTSSKIPITWGDDSLTVIMGTTSEKKILNYLRYCDAIIFMKIGRHLKKIIRVLKKNQLYSKAVVVENASMSSEKVSFLSDIKNEKLPYFSIIMIHGRGRRP